MNESSKREMRYIHLKGVRTHNLKNIDLKIPKDQLVIITGLSGSGKSSLAFDTLYAEGQRRYVESLSSYVKQFLNIADKPDFDSIDGLSPTIAIDQKSTSHNPRSTVGTTTEIYDYLRLLYARIGIPHCPEHHLPLTPQTIEEIVSTLRGLPHGELYMILSPVVKSRKGIYQKLFSDLKQKGFLRVRVNGVVYALDGGDLPEMHKNLKHSIDVVVDRFKSSEEISVQRLRESVETALKLSEGVVSVASIDTPGKEQLFSNKYACPLCDFSTDKLEPSLFSFNSPSGACPHCDGLGSVESVDGEKLIQNPSLSLSQGALKYWNPNHTHYYKELQKLGERLDFSLETPWEALKEAHRKVIFEGDEHFRGAVKIMSERYRETESNFVRMKLHELMATLPCAVCQGERLNPTARNVKVAGHSIATLCNLSIFEALEKLKTLKLPPQSQTIARPILKEVLERLQFLNDVGLHYLTLARSSGTLSGGEAQRIRLAGQIGSGLTGVIYVLDEPSIGLHQRDNQRLIKTLKRLKELGNTLVVVEHDEETMQNADYIIDIGPGSGVHGGQVCAQGTYKEILTQTQASYTARHLSGLDALTPPQARKQGSGTNLVLKGAKGHNLRGDTLSVPLGTLTAITGVSGSGKSTLINRTLYPALTNRLGRENEKPTEPFSSLEGAEGIEQVIRIDQSPIGRTPRSNPATYTGVFTEIRNLLSSTSEARARGYEAGRFSFNVKGGRCEACQGAGLIRVEMHFMSDVYVTCDTCQGKRYQAQTLEIEYRGKNIHDILEMTVEEALEFFKAIPAIAHKLTTLSEVGLGYLKLGHSATHLSGGEAQRVKLASELAKRSHGRALYILDEPTTGLHFHDVKNLLTILLRLRDLGNTLIVIEHNLDVIKMADHIVDLGPEGGDEGGAIIATGTPEAVSQMPVSHTGQFLKPLLSEGARATGSKTAKPRRTK